MKIYKNFKWPVPYAFKDALAKSLFECGDVIYDNEIAYLENWGAAVKKIRYSIQLIKPEKVSGRTVAKKGDSVFENNWKSSVELSITDHKEDLKQKVITFQGNLYKTIWKGSLKFIKEEKLTDIPNGFSYINQNLEKIRLNLGSGLFFVYAIDLTSTPHSQKTADLIEVFNDLGTMHSLSYQDLCSSSKLDLLPTTELNYLKIKTDREEAESLIKKTLYSKSQIKVPNRERFRLRSHGLMIDH